MKEVEQVKEEKPKKPVAKSMMDATEGDGGILEVICSSFASYDGMPRIPPKSSCTTIPGKNLPIKGITRPPKPMTI